MYFWFDFAYSYISTRPFGYQGEFYIGKEFSYCMFLLIYYGDAYEISIENSFTPSKVLDSLYV